MTLEPILAADPIVQIHVCFAVAALLTGPVALFRKRRDRVHKVFGYLAALSMLGLALTGFGIRSTIAIIAHVGPIHILSVMAVWGILEAVYHIRKGDVVRHQASMQSVWFGALGLAGLFTLLPGRTLNRVFFGSWPEAGYIAIGLGLIGLWILWRGRMGLTSRAKS